VGYGDYYPVTELGRITGIFVMFSGVGIIGALASILASVLVPEPDDTSEPAPAATAAGPAAAQAGASSLEAEVAGLRAEIQALRVALSAGPGVSPSSGSGSPG